MCFDFVCMDVHAMLFGSLIGGCVVLSHFYNPFIVLFFSLEIIFFTCLCTLHTTQGLFSTSRRLCLAWKIFLIRVLFKLLTHDYGIFKSMAEPRMHGYFIFAHIPIYDKYRTSIIHDTSKIHTQSFFFSSANISRIHLWYDLDIVVTNPWWWEIAQTCKNFLFMYFIYWFQCWKLI